MNIKKIPANLRLVYAIVSAEKYGPAVMPGERRFVVVVLREAETETKAAAGANFALYPLGKSSSVCARVIYYKYGSCYSIFDVGWL